jgi:hypothetical protein
MVKISFSRVCVARSVEESYALYGIVTVAAEGDGAAVVGDGGLWTLVGGYKLKVNDILSGMVMVETEDTNCVYYFISTMTADEIDPELVHKLDLSDDEDDVEEELSPEDGVKRKKKKKKKSKGKCMGRNAIAEAQPRR